MDCRACGFANATDARFCGRCGAPLERRCATCAEPIAPSYAFCPSCGTRVADQEAAAAEERKVVTVLFADAVGFTSRAEQLDPEDVRGMLVPFHKQVRVELERFGGTVEKFIGDAVMALFGVPVAHEDDPERAVRAALAIRDAVAAHQDGLQVRIGVNTGEALIALGARPSEGEWTAAGDVVNTAQRLEAAAPANAILVGEATYRATRGSVEYQESTPVVAKGKAAPVPAWEAVSAREWLGEAVARDAPLVGRTDELVLLREALSRVRRERSPQLLTVVGVPGIGKSRLVLELHAAVEEADEPVVWLQGNSVPYGGNAFASVAAMVKARANIVANDAADVAGEKLRHTVSRVFADASEAQWVESCLRPLVGLAEEDVLGLDRRSERFAATRRFFEAIAEHDPLVLVFEDLHWADEGVLEFVDQLGEWVSDLPILVLATSRPELLERRPGWGGGKRNALTFTLAPLSEDETERLMDALLEQFAETHTIERDLVVRTGGNPLYAGEYVRMLVDRGAGDGELPLPESVHGIIAARLDALPPEDKAMLHDAAVVGEQFWPGAIGALEQTPREVVEERLKRLIRKEFVRRDRDSTVAGETQYVFRHVLVRDVAYGQLARAARAEKHRGAAAWLESLPPARSEEQAELIAYHYVRALEFAAAAGHDTAELRTQTRRALRSASDRALALSSYASAERLYSQTLELTDPDDASRPELLFRYGRARFHAAQQGASELVAARDALLARGDVELAAEAELMLAALRVNQADRDSARTHLERAAALLEKEGPSRAKADVLTFTGRFLILARQGAEALRVAREALAMAEELGLDDVQAQALMVIGASRIERGDGGGLSDLERALEITVSRNSPEAVRAYRFLASFTLLFGHADRAFSLYAQAQRAVARFGDAFNRRWLEAAGVMEGYFRGQWDDALRRADAFIAEAESGSPHYMEATCRRVRAQIRLARGDVGAALADTERSLAIVRGGRERWFLHAALAVHARVLHAAGRGDEADRTIDDLLAIWREAGPRSLVSIEAADAAVVLDALGRSGDLLDALADASSPTLWHRAAAAYSRGDFAAAADVYAEIGSRPDEAHARLRAGQVEEARSFFEEVGARTLVAHGKDSGGGGIRPRSAS